MTVNKVQPTLIALSVRKPQHIFNQVYQSLRLAINDLQRPPLVSRCFETLQKKRFGKHAYLGQRSAQFVRNLGHKVGPDFD